MITYHLSKSREDLISILKLQHDNLPSSLTNDEINNAGFVTLKHDVNLLRQICGSFGHVVAKSNDDVVGYALVMLKEYSETIPLLKSMFDKIEELKITAKSSYVVMGQICIDKDHRRTGIFRGLYKEMKYALSKDFDEIITEIDERNIRSLNSHRYIGFGIVSTYKSDDIEWVMLSYPLKD